MAGPIKRPFYALQPFLTYLQFAYKVLYHRRSIKNRVERSDTFRAMLVQVFKNIVQLFHGHGIFIAEHHGKMPARSTQGTAIAFMKSSVFLKLIVSQSGIPHIFYLLIAFRAIGRPCINQNNLNFRIIAGC